MPLLPVYYLCPFGVCLDLIGGEALKHPTVQLLQASLPEMELFHLHEPDALSALHRQMQVGDLRLPFVISVDHLDRGVYATANYNIRMAQTLLMIHKLIAGGK